MNVAPLKIAYVTMQFPVASEAFAAVELRALQRLGADITVLAYRRPPAHANALLAERGLANLPVDQGSLAATLRGLAEVVLRPQDSLPLIATVLWHCRGKPWQLAKALALVPRSLGMLKRLEVLKPDIVHLFWGHYPSLVGLLAKRRLPLTVVSHFLGAYDLEQGFPLSIQLARQADRVTTHAEANLPALAALGFDPARVDVCYRGIEVPTPLPAPKKIRGLMVVAERLVPQKRTTDTLRVFAEVAKRSPDARLHVLGDGPESPHLKSLARQLDIEARVIFAGHVSHDEVFRRLAEAEIAITMSQSPSERLPNALKEAMLQRCLCLTTRSTGIEELIDDGKTGLLVDPGDIAGAARVLGTTLNDGEAVARIGGRAQARILADFDIDRLMAERLRLWSTLNKARLSGAAA
ncbi:MAG: glycosyltransferase [Kiloniellaceae bacterium]